MSELLVTLAIHRWETLVESCRAPTRRQSLPELSASPSRARPDSHDPCCSGCSRSHRRYSLLPRKSNPKNYNRESDFWNWKLQSKPNKTKLELLKLSNCQSRTLSIAILVDVRDKLGVVVDQVGADGGVAARQLLQRMQSGRYHVLIVRCRQRHWYKLNE